MDGGIDRIKDTERCKGPKVNCSINYKVQTSDILS